MTTPIFYLLLMKLRRHVLMVMGTELHSIWMAILIFPGQALIFIISSGDLEERRPCLFNFLCCLPFVKTLRTMHTGFVCGCLEGIIIFILSIVPAYLGTYLSRLIIYQCF